MKTFRYVAILATLFLAQYAQADVIMIKKNQKTEQTEEAQSLHRYESEIARMNKATSGLADRMLNPEKYAKKTAKNDGMQVALIPKR